MSDIRHQIDLSLNASAYRRIKQAQEETFGRPFWQRSHRGASKELRKHLKESVRIGDDAANTMSRQFDTAFKNSAENFGSDVKSAAQKGSDEYVKSMTRAIDRVSRVQADTDTDRVQSVQNIINMELKGLQDKLKLNKKISDDYKSFKKPIETPDIDIPSHTGGRRADAFKSLIDKSKGALEKGGKFVGGKSGEMLSKTGGSIGKLGKFAGAAGVILGVVAALGILAKKALEIQQEIKRMNTAMTQSTSATDMMAAGFLTVEDGVTALRHEFMEGVRANFKWRMTTEETYEAYNALISSGVTLGKLNKQLGREVSESGRTARDVVDITKTYATQFKTGVSDIGSFMGDLMLNLGYSFTQASNSLAAIDMQAQKSGLSAGIFFSKVQSLNSQLGIMNASLQVQADVLSDVVQKGPLGLEEATTAITNVLGKLDEQSARNIVAFVGETKAMAMVHNELVRVENKLANPDIDATLRRRLEAERSQIQQALAGGMVEVMNLFEGGLTSEISNLEARFTALSKVLGKSVDKLSYKDLINVTFEQTEMLKQLGIMGGSTEEVNKNLMALAGMIEANGGIKETLADMNAKSMQPLKEEISEDIRLAQDMLRETEDISKILTNIKEWMFSSLYDILSGMYDLMIDAFGSDQDKMIREYDKAIRKNVNEQQTATGGQLDLLKEQERAIKTERETVSGYNEKDFEKFLEAYGGGSIRMATKARLGSGDRGGAITGGSGTAITSETKLPSIVPTKEERAYTEKVKASGENQVKLGREARSIAQEELKTRVWDVNDILTNNKDYQKWASYEMPTAWRSAPPSVRVFAFADAQGFLDEVDPKRRSAITTYLNALENPMAKGGVVNRPTPALIGEAGPEAVVPLKKGALGSYNLHIHGNVYGMDELYDMFKKSIRDFERSQRI